MDFVDAFLLSDPEVGEEYKGFGEDEVERVKFILSKLHSDRVNRTSHFSNKFVAKIENAFQNLSRSMDLI